MKEAFLTCRIDPDLMADLEACAARKGWSRSDAVREALADWVAKNERKTRSAVGKREVTRG